MLNEEMEISAASITDRWSLLDDAPPFQDSEGCAIRFDGTPSDRPSSAGVRSLRASSSTIATRTDPAFVSSFLVVIPPFAPEQGLAKPLPNAGYG
ncbi:MAG: hypothetical protein ABI595_12630 [Actinomycetota bacterium]